MERYGLLPRRLREAVCRCLEDGSLFSRELTWGKIEHYDLGRDPGEQVDLGPSPEARQLAGEAVSWFKSLQSPVLEPAELSPALEAAVEACLTGRP